MSHLAMKLDTLSYAKKLIAAGCEPKLAEAHAALQQETLVEISEDYLSQVTTKEDLKQFATKEDLKQFATKEDLKQYATKEELFSMGRLLEQKMENLGMKITLKLGVLMTTGIIILAALIELH